MYPRNAATPPTIAVGSIYQISDGALVTSGASARVLTAGGSWGAAAGSLACDSTSGCWTYAPTQGETNGAWFLVAVYKSSCTAASVTVVTTASDTAGYAVCHDTQKVDVNTIKTKSVTVDAGGTTFPASIHAAGAAVAKSPATLAAADVSGSLPADVKQWNGGALPTIGTSTLTTSDIDARLAAVNLDHLVGTAEGIPALPAGTYLDQALRKSDGAYDRDTDSLEAIRDTAPLGTPMRGTDGANTVVPDAAGTAAGLLAALESHGDAAWATATGFATAADVTDAQTAIQDDIAALNDLDAAAVRTAVGLAEANLDDQLAAVSAPTAEEVADAVWDEAIAGHLDAGTTGKKLSDAGAAGDPLAAEVPGAYAAGTAGAALGNVPGIKAKTDLLGAASVTVSSPVVAGGRAVTLVRGDDYLAEDGRALEWSAATWPDLTGAEIAFTARDKTTGTAALEAAGEIVTAGTGTQQVRVELESAATALLTPGTLRYVFDVEATLASGSIVTLVLGFVSVLEDQTL